MDAWRRSAGGRAGDRRAGAVPNGLDPRHAALTEPMAVGLHAVNKSRIERSEAALVLGCGPIGIAIVAAHKNQRCRNHCGR